MLGTVYVSTFHSRKNHIKFIDRTYLSEELAELYRIIALIMESD